MIRFPPPIVILPPVGPQSGLPNTVKKKKKNSNTNVPPLPEIKVTSKAVVSLPNESKTPPTTVLASQSDACLQSPGGGKTSAKVSAKVSDIEDFEKSNMQQLIDFDRLLLEEETRRRETMPKIDHLPEHHPLFTQPLETRSLVSHKVNEAESEDWVSKVSESLRDPVRLTVIATVFVWCAFFMCIGPSWALLFFFLGAALVEELRWGAVRKGIRFAEFLVECSRTFFANDPFGTPPTSKSINTKNRFRQEALARTDLLYSENEKLVTPVPLGDVASSSNFNFKVKCRVNEDTPVLCEIDSDSHISLITEQYFRRLQSLGPLEILDEDPIAFEGLGSRIQTKFPPVMLALQIGRCTLRGRFIVTEHLSSSPVLLGTDFCVKNCISIAPYSSGSWFVHVGPIDQPIGKVQALVTNKIVLCSDSTVRFKPFEIKKIKVCYSVPQFESEFARDTPCYQTLTPSEGLKLSPFQLLDDDTDDSSITVQNVCPVATTLPVGLEVASAEFDLRSYQVSSEMDAREVSPDESGEPILDSQFLAESALEPGINSPSFVDKDAEILFVSQHKDIPQKYKKELIDFLLARENLFSGEEFSKDSFPPDKYSHDVELVDDLKSLSSRPFPVSGIRLAQLKEDIAALVANGVLSPGDSSFTSPCFYVMKKPGEGKTAAKGRLCFDYRRINAHIKAKNFPLTTVKNFFDEASKFKFFSVLDIQNAFLSIPLTQRAREYLAVITPFGTFLPNRSPYGLKTSPSAFCFALYMVLHDLKFVQYYMDDIYVGANSEREMIDHLKIVMDRLYQFNLKIRLSKTKFFVKSIKLLGVIYTPTGKRVDPEKISAIQKFGAIDTVKKLQCFLGMLAYLASFIPHFSTVCAPLYALLKKNNVPFKLTKEALVAYDVLKEYIGKTTMLYHVDLERPLYLSTDASNVGAGGFLYQIMAYEKNLSGYRKMMADLGFEIEKGAPAYLLPGVSSGKNTPVVTEFVNDKSLIKKHDPLNTLDPTLTTTEKVKLIEDNYVLNVNPVSFYSKSFSESQALKYSTMEKELISLMWCVLNFKDYLQSAPITYLLTDSQPVCWALRHKDDNVKLSRWLCKLFELNVELLVTHVVGVRNSVADFLSRLYYVPEAKTKDNLGPKSAQHICCPFPYLSVLTPEDVLKGFTSELVTPCEEPTLCHLNVNKFLFQNVGPFEHKYTCLDKQTEVKVIKISKADGFCFSPGSLNKYLTIESIFEHQRKDEKLIQIINNLEKGNPVGNYFLENGILYKKFDKETRPCVIVVPQSLVMYVLASSHFVSHAGAEKLLALIGLKYFWKSMKSDAKEFSAGCVLCQIFKSSTQGPNEVGTPRIVLGPGQCFQMDIVSGLVSVRGYKSFLNVIDMYTGFAIPIPLKKETSEEIARVLENQIIKIFGPPVELSSDNASNLSGPPIRKLAKFFNFTLRQTVPYSPTSHSLVENANRYITQLTRIFSDQFNAHWVDTLALAALVFNSIPRPQLQNHSPYFIMFNRELFDDGHLSVKKNEDLDIDTYLKRSLNDRMFVSLLRERLLKIREKRNAEKSKTYRSFPPRTLILVKDLRPRVHRKLKPVYFKLPQMIIKEYRCTVFAQDVFGRVHKHAKNNVKLASQRSADLFGKLPTELKIALGDEFDEERWLAIKDSGVVPTYLMDIEINAAQNASLRGNLPEAPELDSAIFVPGAETPQAPDPDHNAPTVGLGLDDGVLDIDDDLVDNDETVRQLGLLHDAGLLNDPGLRLRDVPGVYEANSVLLADGETRHHHEVDPGEILLAGDTLDEAPLPPQPARRRPSFGIDPANIIPPTIRRRVRFNLPQATID